MLSIYICDDIIEITRQFEKYIKKYLLCRDDDMELVCAATTPGEVLDILSMKGQCNTGLYFLDVDLKSSMDGFQLAASIREKDPNGFIVFITDHGERSYDTFKYHLEALDYICKADINNIEERIRDCIDLAYRRYQTISSDPEKYYTGHAGSRKYFLPLKDILYFTTSNTPHQLKVHLTSEIYSVRGDIKNLEAQLDERFFRCEKSCLVNLEHVRYVERNTRLITLDNQSQIPISQSGLKLFLRNYPDLISRP